MNRRAFLTGIGTGLLAAPRVAVGQVVKVHRIGLLATRPTAVFSDHFESEMHKRGWKLDRDYIVESRFTDGDYQRAPRLAAELVNLPVDILLTFNTSNARVARNATDTIPIIMITSGYPVESGLAVSLARPGGNVTGNSVYAGGEVFAKHLSLIREVKPIRKLGIVWDYGPPAFDPRDGEQALAELRKAARALSVTVTLQMIRSREDVIPALGVFERERVDSST